MQGRIMVVDADIEQCNELCSVLSDHRYAATALYSLADLEREIGGRGCRVVLLDLDTLAVDNRLIRELKRINPLACIMGLSSRTFHPELKESMSSHIYACLNKPVDPEELIFWLRSVCENETNQ